MVGSLTRHSGICRLFITLPGISEGASVVADNRVTFLQMTRLRIHPLHTQISLDYVPGSVRAPMN